MAWLVSCSDTSLKIQYPWNPTMSALDQSHPVFFYQYKLTASTIPIVYTCIYKFWLGKRCGSHSLLGPLVKIMWVIPILHVSTQAHSVKTVLTDVFATCALDTWELWTQITSWSTGLCSYFVNITLFVVVKTITPNHLKCAGDLANETKSILELLFPYFITIVIIIEVLNTILADQTLGVWLFHNRLCRICKVWYKHKFLYSVYTITYSYFLQSWREERVFPWRSKTQILSTVHCYNRSPASWFLTSFPCSPWKAGCYKPVSKHTPNVLLTGNSTNLLRSKQIKLVGKYFQTSIVSNQTLSSIKCPTDLWRGICWEQMSYVSALQRVQ